MLSRVKVTRAALYVSGARRGVFSVSTNTARRSDLFLYPLLPRLYLLPRLCLWRCRATIYCELTVQDTNLFNHWPTHSVLTRNDVTFTKALWKLLGFISLIQADGINRRRGLTLELSASSPSDGKHWFQIWPGLQDDYPHGEDLIAQYHHLRGKSSNTNSLSDEDHGITWARQTSRTTSLHSS